MSSRLLNCAVVAAGLLILLFSAWVYWPGQSGPALLDDATSVMVIGDLKQHPEQAWTGLAPFRAEDIVAGFIFKTPLFYGLDDTLKDLFGGDHTQAIALDPQGEKKAFLMAPRTLSERGSNGFAVSPARSDDGVTRFLI